MWPWRRRGRMGRPPKPRRLSRRYAPTIYIPSVGGVPMADRPPVIVTPDEVEALRLVYYLGLSQSEAAERMGVSRGTLWRLLSSARRKVATALAEVRPIEIAP